VTPPSVRPYDDDAYGVARTIIEGFDKHYRLFRTISGQAKQRFERGDWSEVQRANVERIEMYDRRVEEGVRLVLSRYPASVNESLWPSIKQAFILQLIDHQQPELAQTYFNSVASRVLHRTYYKSENMFRRSVISTEHIESIQKTWSCYYPATQGLRPMLRQMVADLQLANAWEDLERDVAAVIRAMSAFLPRPLEWHANVQVQVLSSLFYRNQAAYLIGMIVNGHERTPFAVPIRHNARHEIYLDALLLHRVELGALFSLARAYFMVDMEVPAAFVGFLKWIFPDKPTAELYTALGLQKQGKTLFYRDMVEHLRHSTDGFVAAPGVPGMVMVVFTLPSFPYVFKVIRDTFEAPKDSDRESVMAQYRRVKNHDRVGRLADTLEFSEVAFPLGRFAPALLDELEAKASSMLQVSGNNVVIRHLYIERRMTPLDLYLRRAEGEEALRHGLRDYGNCVRELAFANIFPGDLLLKNFGVTRFGRVVFYDYDEIALLTQCHFRELPRATHDEDEYASEPWFAVSPNDVFPEEIPKFLFPEPRWKEIFLEEHPTLFTAEFWRSTQRRVASGEQIAFTPYPLARRFPHAHVESIEPPAPAVK
jgi:isocitrate dehydrogenase kinase/phosphatase